MRGGTDREEVIRGEDDTGVGKSQERHNQARSCALARDDTEVCKGRRRAQDEAGIVHVVAVHSLRRALASPPPRGAISVNDSSRSLIGLIAGQVRPGSVG